MLLLLFRLCVGFLDLLFGLVTHGINLAGIYRVRTRKIRTQFILPLYWKLLNHLDLMLIVSPLLIVYLYDS